MQIKTCDCSPSCLMNNSFDIKTAGVKMLCLNSNQIIIYFSTCYDAFFYGQNSIKSPLKSSAILHCSARLGLPNFNFSPPTKKSFLRPCYTRKNAQVGTRLQTSCNKSVHKLSTNCVRIACSLFVVTSLEQVVNNLTF